jgi:hypothetical protein
MQQLSHQILNSGPAFSAFGTFIVPLGFIRIARLLLKARDRRVGVIRLVPAIFQRAGQHKFSGRHGLVFSLSFGAVEGKQNGQAALLAANAEIPSQISFGPSRNIQRISLPS